MAGFTDISELRAFLEREGVRTAYIKKLSEKQDNEKNQIYFGSQLPGLINLFPARLSFREGSTSTQKRRSKAGQPIIEAKLNFAWLSRSGERFKTPHTKIIDYFQYPEVRMSGFLRDCTNPPDALRRENQRAYGQRVLVLGTALPCLAPKMKVWCLKQSIRPKAPCAIAKDLIDAKDALRRARFTSCLSSLHNSSLPRRKPQKLSVTARWPERPVPL